MGSPNRDDETDETDERARDRGAERERDRDGERAPGLESESESNTEPGPDPGSDPAHDQEADEAEGDWEFGLDDVGPEAERRRRLEPQAIDPANALFVLLGIAAAAGVVWLLLF
jgi:hypothetical protein